MAEQLEQFKEFIESRILMNLEAFKKTKYLAEKTFYIIQGP